MRKSITVAIATFVAGSILGATSVYAGERHGAADGYVYFYTTSDNCPTQKKANDEPQDQVETAKANTVVGPEPMYIGF